MKRASPRALAEGASSISRSVCRVHLWLLRWPPRLLELLWDNHLVILAAASEHSSRPWINLSSSFLRWCHAKPNQVQQWRTPSGRRSAERP